MELRIRLALRPTPKQQALLDSRAPIVAMVGGVGGAKTTGAALKLLQLIAENPGQRGLLVVPTAPLLHATTLAEFREICPSELIAGENKQRRYIDFVNGARLYYWSADGKARLVGFNAAFGLLDEFQECQRWVFEKLLARVRSPKAQRRQLVLVGIPSMGWVHDLLAEPAEGVEVIHVATSDNPYLPADYVDRLRANYDPTLFAQMVEGKFVQLAGLVFDNYLPARHLVDQGPSTGIDTWVGVDLGYNLPAVVFLQRRIQFGVNEPAPRRAAFVVVDEEMPDKGSAADLAEVIRRRGYKIAGIRVDPTCTADERMALSKAGPVSTAEGEDAQSRKQGIERMRAALLDATGQTRLFFSRRLLEQERTWKRGVLKDIIAYKWKKASAQAPVAKEPHKDGKHDHSMDATRYIIDLLCPPEDLRRGSHYAR